MSSAMTALRRLVTAVLVLSLIGFTTAGPASADLSPDGDGAAWVANDRVFAITQVGDVIYVGGRFTQVAPNKSATYSDRAYLAAFEADSGQFISSFTPVLNGEVRALASSADGSRLFVGGSFTSVNGEARNAIVSVDPATGATDSGFAVTANVSTVFDIEVDGSRVYLAGDFTALNGVPNASRAARVNASTGAVDASWKPRPNARVETIAIPPSGDRVYLGGKFSSLAGVSADNLASVRVDNAAIIEDFEADSDSGCDSPNRPPAGIRSIDATNNRIMAAPYNNNCLFVFQPGQRNRLYQYDGDGDFQVVHLVGNRFYVGGHSATIDGFPQNRMYGFNIDGTFDPSFTTDAAGQPGVFAYYGSGSNLWVGGTIFTIGSTSSVKDVGRVGPAPGESVPSTPTGLSVSVGSNQATLSWQASSDPNGIEGYRVLRGNEQLAYVNGGTTSYVDVRFRNGEVNEYRIEAIDNRHNTSQRSESVLAGLDGIVITPVAGQASAVGDTVNLTITALGGAGSLSYSATGLPTGLDIAPNGVISGVTTATGSYTPTVTVTDGSTSSELSFAWVVVNDSIPVGPQPLAVLTGPTPGVYLEGGTTSILGIASDDSGVDSVGVSVRNRTTGLYLQSDGSYASGFARIDAAVLAPSETVSAFRLDVASVPDGVYEVTALPTGVDGSVGETDRLRFTMVGSLGEDPYGDLQFPEARTNVYGAFSIIGTATDNVGVARVEVLVKEKFPTNAGRRLQDDFTLDAAYNTFDAEMSAPGAPVTRYWLDLPANLPGDNPWQVRVIITDTDGNRFAETLVNGFGIDGEYYAGRNAETPYPVPDFDQPSGALAPVVSITSPSATVQVPATANIAGTVTDNNAVASVAVRVRNDGGLYLQPGGGFAGNQADLPASVSGHNSSSASFSYDAGALALGGYTVEVVGTDASTLSTTSTRNFSVVSQPAGPSDIRIGAGQTGNGYNISNGSELSATRNLLLDQNRFGPNGTYEVDSVTIVEDVANLTQGYLDDIDIYFNGWVPDSAWSSAELTLLENWVNAGGVVVASNDDVGFDGPANQFGNPVLARGDGTWSAAGNGPIVNGPFGSWTTVQGATSVFGYFGTVPGWTVSARNSAGQPTIVSREVGSGYVILTSDEGVFRTNIPGSNATMVSNLFADAMSFVEGDAATPPTIDPIANQTSQIGDTISLQVQATSPDGTLTYSEVGLPAGLGINANGLISGTVTTAETADVTITAASGSNGSVATSFTWTVEGQPDTVEPDSTVEDPQTGNPQLDTGPLTLSGTATDDASGVDRVRVGIRDRVGLTWLQADGSFATAVYLFDADLDAQGTTSTGWSLDVTLPAGSYAVIPRAVDSAGNVESVRPWRSFTVADAVTDVVEPDTTVTDPQVNDNLAAGAITLTGEATDDASGIGEVRVSVRDRVGLLWMQPDGTFASTFASIPAELSDPGATSTTWSFDVTLPAGNYAVAPRGFDVAGNRESARPWVVFSVS